MVKRAFENLCYYASQHGWRHNPSCYPCCHEEFRKAWPLMIQGLKPGNSAWDEATQLMLAQDPAVGFKLALRDQAALARIMGEADLDRIARRCLFPNWLGYLGLGLYYTKEHEKRRPVLTKAWAPQLIRLVTPDSESEDFLIAILGAQRGPPGSLARRLRWTDLERLARDVGPPFRRKRLVSRKRASRSS